VRQEERGREQEAGAADRLLQQASERWVPDAESLAEPVSK